MITKELVDFIKKSKAEGHTDQSIKDVLTKNGWLPADVEEGFRDLSKPPLASTPPPVAKTETTIPPSTVYQAPSLSSMKINPTPVSSPVASPQMSSTLSSTERPLSASVNVMPKKSHSGILTFFIVLLFFVALGAPAY